jgi:hypothetical protein
LVSFLSDKDQFYIDLKDEEAEFNQTANNKKGLVYGLFSSKSVIKLPIS